MEYIDICDEQGNLTGKKVPRDEIHRMGHWHKAVHIWILNSKGELLIQLRSPLKENHPNMWDISVAGHVESGDSSIKTALKELEEELGLKVVSNDFRHIFTVEQKSVEDNGTYINNEINDIYLIEMDVGLSELQLQESEVTDVKFISIPELEEKVRNNDGLIVPHPEEYEKLFEYLKINK